MDNIKIIVATLITVLIGYVIFLNNEKNIILKDKSKKSFVLYYADWCPHCKKMLPEWEKIENEKLDISIKKIECDEKKSKKYKINSYPTIRLYKDSRIIEYNGPRNYNGFKIFLSKHI